MKTPHIVAAMLLGAVCVAPLSADTQLQSKAVSLATAQSGATLSDICYALYNAVKADPSQADKMLAAVLAQRSDWTSPQVYALLRSTMMACPGLDTYVGSAKPSSEGGSQSGETSVPPMLQSLLQVVGQASLPLNVVQGVFGSIAATSPLSYGQVYRVANLPLVVDGELVEPPVSGEVVPGPDQMSPLH